MELAGSYHTSGPCRPNCKLTPRDVELLLILRGEGYSIRWLADKFEISRSVAGKIVLRQKWRHIMWPGRDDGS